MIDLDDRPLIETHGVALRLKAAISAVEWIGDEAWFACGDGRVERFDMDGARTQVTTVAGAILCAAVHPDGKALLTGSDNGQLNCVGVDGSVQLLGDFGGKWVDHVVASPNSGLIVAGVGKEAIVWKPKQSDAAHRYAFASTIGGLALDAKGKRLAASHYGGTTLVYASSADSGRVELKWAGSHLACTISPQGDYVVTAMQETGLHGWQLPGMSNMAMHGYRAKTRSFSWSRRGKWLATSGDPAVIIWPFDGKAGPMNRAPLTLQGHGALVARVAFHPSGEFIAVGYADGAVTLAHLSEDRFASIQAAGSASITALAWDAQGSCLAWGDEDGAGGLLPLNRLPRS